MKNWILAALCTAFAVVCYISTRSFPDPGVTYRSPAIYPQAVIVLIVLLSVAVVVIEMARKRSETSPGKKSLTQPLMVLAILAGYFVLMPIIGFVVGTFVFILVAFVLFGGNLRHGSLFATAMTAGQYILFVILLDVRVPDPVIAFIKQSF